MRTNLLIFSLIFLLGPLSSNASPWQQIGPNNSRIWLVDLDHHNNAFLETQIVRSHTFRHLTLSDAIESANMTIICSVALKIDIIQRHHEYVCFSSASRFKALKSYMRFQLERKKRLRC